MPRIAKPHFFCRLAYLVALAPVLTCTSAEDTAAGPEEAETVAPEAATSVTPPTHEDFANATFDSIGEVPFQLTRGRWEGEPFEEGGASVPTAGLVDDFILQGDLTGDGTDESIALLWTNSGGTGTFSYIAAATREDQGISILGTAEIGDRIQVRSGRIVDGRVELDVVQGGPEDAACCPSQLATRNWTLGADGFAEGDPEVTGTLSIEAFGGTEWVLSNFTREEQAPTEPEVTLTVEEGRIAGSSGCNRYFAEVSESDGGPGSLSIGLAGSTQMMCPDEAMAVEDRFLKQLGGADSYSFLAGKLVINFELGDDYGSMIFTPHQP